VKLTIGGVALVVVLVLAGCGDDGGDTTDTSATDTSATDTTADTTADTTPDVADTTPAGDCVSPGGAGPRFAQTDDRFLVRTDATYRWLSGGVFDGPLPAPHVEAEREGACRLLTYTPSSCTPACEWGDACIAGVCAQRPAYTSVGTLTVSGLTPSPLVLEPIVDFNGYDWSQDGAYTVTAVTLAAAGAGDVPAFTLEACGVPALEPIGDWSALMEARDDGEDVTLTWRDPAPGARFYLRMTTGIGTHGGISPVEVECEGPDEGRLVLPGGFLDALYATGWSCGECGDNRLFRYRAAEAAAADHTIQLRVVSEATFWFRP